MRAFLFSILFLPFALAAQQPDYAHGTDIQPDAGKCVAVDPSGNVSIAA